MSYELIDHTGDIGIVARAPTLEALFAECARAMFEILAEAADPRPAAEESFDVRGEDPAGELRDFLAELLYRFSAERKMYVTFVPGSGKVVAGEQPFDPARHALRTELKAVTWHQLDVTHGKTEWTARVIFDV
jgi:SHS2 domain-containing protein